MKDNNTEPDTMVMSSTTQLFRFVALFNFIGLLAWMVTWYFVLPIEQKYSIWFVLIIFIAPLLFPAKGIVLGKPYTHAWASFVVLFYFVHAITVMYAESNQWLYALIELILAVNMFIGCSVYARKRGQELGSGLPKLSTVMADEKRYFESNKQ